MRLWLILATSLVYELPSDSGSIVEKWMNNDTKITKYLMKSFPRHLKAIVNTKEYSFK